MDGAPGQDAQIGGGGGGGGFNGNGSGATAITNASSLTGGNGGNGGAGNSGAGSGGGGGAGGFGALVTGSNRTSSNAGPGTIMGGSGGSGGSADVASSDGNGGDGGVGVLLTASAAGASFTNSGMIAGGKGGSVNPGVGGGANGGNGGAGGVGARIDASGVTLTNTATISAGTGSNGSNGIDNGDAPGGNGGAGGAGGTGALFNGSGAIFVNSSTVTGLTGGNGGNGGGSLASGGNGGNGGSGGAGVQFAAGGASFSNSGTVTGGNGGTGGTGGRGATSNGTNGIVGAGGVGIAGTGLALVNSGSVTGGLSGDGVTRADAIRFTGGTNSLTLEAGFSITGNVVAFSAADIFALGGAANASFDVTQIGATAQYQGFGVFQKTGTSTWTLTGTNTATMPWTILQGTLAVTGEIASSTMTIQSGGTLGGSGTVGAIVAQSGATVAPGVITPFSTLNVTGNASFAAGSTFTVNINSAGQNDKLSIGGTATLNGGTVQVLGGAGITTVSKFTILTAQSVTGQFANVTSNLAFLTPRLTTNATSVVLSVTPAGSLAAAAATTNEIAVANAIQALGSGPIFNAVIGQSVAGAQQAFDALSGEIHASTVTAAYEDALLPQGAILDRLSQPAASPLLGAAVETTGAYAADLPSRKGPALAPVAVRMYQPRLFDLWGQGFGDWGRVSGDGNAASLSRQTGGFVLGGDVTATNMLGGTWRFGLAGGYTNDRITVSQRLSSATFESVFGGAYAGASFGALQLRAGALYGANTTSTSRQVTFPGFSEALSSSNGGYTAQAFGEVGYRIELADARFGWLGASRATIEPFAGAAAFLIHQNGFAEEGGISALTGTARDFNVQTTTLGLRSELAFAAMPLTLKTMLGWRHAYGDVVPSVLLAFQGGAQNFSASGVPIDRDAFVTEAGLDYALTSLLTVGVSYSGQFGQRSADNSVKGNLNLRF